MGQCERETARVASTRVHPHVCRPRKRVALDKQSSTAKDHLDARVCTCYAVVLVDTVVFSADIQHADRAPGDRNTIKLAGA